MGSGIDPKVDYAFKRVFGSPENNGVLKHLLNAVLRGSWPTIESVEVRNPFSLKDAHDERLTILDIKARDGSGAEYLIEMQLMLPKALPERIVYYTAKAYSQQLTEGGRYRQLRPVITVCFLNAVLFPKVADYHGRYELREVTRHTPLTNHWQIHIVELPKFHTHVEQLRGDIERWTYFLQHGNELDEKSLPPTLAIPEIAQATGTLTMISQVENEREQYEARRKFQMDQASELEDALLRGREEGREEGRVIEARKTLLKVAGSRFNGVPDGVATTVEGIDDLNQLHDLLDKALDATDWTTLFPDH